MKIMLRKDKYVFKIAGVGSIGPYGYYTPYHVWRRVWYFPFCYTFFGFCNLTTTTTQKDVQEWIEWQESKRKEADDGND